MMEQLTSAHSLRLLLCTLCRRRQCFILKAPTNPREIVPDWVRAEILCHAYGVQEKESEEIHVARDCLRLLMMSAQQLVWGGQE